MKSVPRAALAALTATGLGACISVGYERELVLRPVDAAEVERLEPGVSDLGLVLARLGAPLFVREGADGEILLGYGSRSSRAWSFSVSTPVSEQFDASFDYDQAEAKLEGYLLVFSESLELRLVRRGLLNELDASVRARPAEID